MTMSSLSKSHTLSLSLSLSLSSLSSLITKQSTRPLSSMERSAWPESLSSSGKREIQEIYGQNPEKLRDAFDAHSQTGDDPRQPLFAGNQIYSVLESFRNTQSLSSDDESYEVLQVPSNACIMSEVSDESESVGTHVQLPSQMSLQDMHSEIEIWRHFFAVPNPMRNLEQELMGFTLSKLESYMSPPPGAELFTMDNELSFQSLHNLSSCFKIGFMAANLTIVEAASEQSSTNKLHVIDFGVFQEKQYVNLLHVLSTRQAGNQSTLKITTLADSLNGEERMVGDRLSKLAAKMGVRLVFNIVSQKLTELSRDSLGCEPDEVLAVNLVSKLYRMPDKSVSEKYPRDEVLRCVKGLAPPVVTLVEQEMNGNVAPFTMRVGEALKYYGALLRSIMSTVPTDNSKPARAEQRLGRKLGSSVAWQGRVRMMKAGFKLEPLIRHAAKSLETRFSSMNRVNSAFKVKTSSASVGVFWRDRPLTSASAWRLPN